VIQFITFQGNANNIKTSSASNKTLAFLIHYLLMQELDKYFNETKDHEVLLDYTYNELSNIIYGNQAHVQSD
jgi:hypothetical protein